MLTKRIIRYRQPTAKPISPWRIALLEIAIIIIGILLSLAITSFFANRKDNQRETAYLTALVEELELDLQYLQGDLQQRAGQMQACQTMATSLSTGGFNPKSMRQTAATLTELSKTVNFNPSMATFRAMESTGRIELIDNDEIVRHLIILYTRYFDLIEQNNDDVTRYRDNFLLPFIVRSFNFSAATSQQKVANPLLRPPADITAEMTNHMIYNQISLGSTITAYQQAISFTKETLSLINQELG